jgi:hypothetical protein
MAMTRHDVSNMTAAAQKAQAFRPHLTSALMTPLAPQSAEHVRDFMT